MRLYADVAELVDALRSGRSESNLVEVQVLSSAPYLSNYCFFVDFIVLYTSYGLPHRSSTH